MYSEKLGHRPRPRRMGKLAKCRHVLSLDSIPCCELGLKGGARRFPPHCTARFGYPRPSAAYPRKSQQPAARVFRTSIRETRMAIWDRTHGCAAHFLSSHRHRAKYKRIRRKESESTRKLLIAPKGNATFRISCISILNKVRTKADLGEPRST